MHDQAGGIWPLQEGVWGRTAHFAHLFFTLFLCFIAPYVSLSRPKFEADFRDTNLYLAWDPPPSTPQWIARTSMKRGLVWVFVWGGGGASEGGGRRDPQRPGRRTPPVGARDRWGRRNAPLPTQALRQGGRQGNTPRPTSVSARPSSTARRFPE